MLLRISKGIKELLNYIILGYSCVTKNTKLDQFHAYFDYFHLKVGITSTSIVTLKPTNCPNLCVNM